MITSGAIELVWVVSVADSVVVVVAVVVGGVVGDAPADGVDASALSVVGLVVAAVGLEEADESTPLSPVSESGDAHATPAGNATAIPTPNITANAPTRPMCFACPMSVPLLAPPAESHGAPRTFV